MMGTTSAGSSSNQNQHQNVNINVFTAAQWEELEQQALIYKYMVSGVPVPTHLILSVRTSLYNSSSSSSFSNQPSLGVWEGGFHQLYHHHQIGGVSGYAAGGHGRKIDLEPGRCRRTDGKKWRCSKEAYPDSKYCERHMHRGRNRSRKPVEFPSSSSSSTSSSSSSTATSLTTVSSSPSTTLSKSISHSDHTYPQFSSLQTNFMDYRYLQGMKELGEDERSAYNLHLHDPYTTTQKMTPHHQNQHHHHNYSHFNFQNLNKDQQQHKQEEEEGEETQGQHCYVMGTDFIKSIEEEKSTSQVNTKSDETTTKQPFHHFFSTPKTTPNPNPNPDPAWIEINQHQHQLINPTKSTLSTQDLFQSTPRPYW